LVFLLKKLITQQPRRFAQNKLAPRITDQVRSRTYNTKARQKRSHWIAWRNIRCHRAYKSEI